MALCSEYYLEVWAILLAGISLSYLYFERKFGYWRRRDVPCSSLCGCFKRFYESFTKPGHETSFEDYRTYGRVYGIYFGLKPALVVGDPELLKNILVKDFHSFPNRLEFRSGEPLFDKQMAFLQGEDWKRIRSIISPTFSSGRIKKMAYLVKECAVRFAEYCERTAETVGEVDCKKFYSRFAIDIIASTAFGTKINAMENVNHPFVRHANELSGKNSLSLILTLFFPTLRRLLKLDSNIDNAMKYFRDFALHVIDERDRNNIRANDFLQLMIDAQRGKLDNTGEDLKEVKEDPKIFTSNKNMSLQEVLAQCILFFRAGSDTSSNALTFISYYLALNPKYQERLIEEIDDAWCSDDDITFDVLSKMTYLEAFINEVLRIQPVSAALMRICDTEYQLGDTGIKIEKGTVIVVPIYAMHRDPEHFSEPEKFDPERFMPPNRQKINPYAYLPFGVGPRNCIGMRFAVMVLKLCIIHTLRKIRFEATEKTKRRLEFLVGQPVLQAKEVWVKMVKRNDV